MDRNSEVNSIRAQADDDHSNAWCTVREYLAQNPYEDIDDYVALIEARYARHYDKHAMRLYRARLLELAERDH